MLVKTLRFVSLLCAALTLALTLAHDLQIPGKQMLRGADWLIVQQTFYGGFALVGGVAEVLGLISTGFLLVLLRERRASFILTVVAALSFVSMHESACLDLWAARHNGCRHSPVVPPATHVAAHSSWSHLHGLR